MGDSESVGKPIAFVDIDGTFIDSGYKPCASPETLAKWADRCRLVFVSSRTVEEISALLASLDLEGDFMPENGSALCTTVSERACAMGATPLPSAGGKAVFAAELAPRAESFAETAKSLSIRHGLRIRWVGDMSARELAEASGYSIDEARLALHRRWTIMFSATAIPGTFAADLEKAGLRVSFGGRWFSISSGADKGTAIREYIDRLHSEDSIETFGIGNSPNDRSMLESVRHPFVVRNPGTGHDKTLMEVRGVVPCAASGTAGFAEMMAAIERTSAATGE